VFGFFSGKLGCLGSLLVSIVVLASIVGTFLLLVV
jgi:hypothetical protein